MANPTLEMIHGMLYGKGLRFGKLGSLGRIIAIMTGKRADRVAFMGPQIHDHAMTVARIPARKFYWDADLLVDVHLAVNRWYRFDSDSIIADVYNFEVEALGADFIYSDTAMPTVNTNKPLLREHADLDRIGPLDITKGRIPMGIEMARLVSEKIEGPLGLGFFCSPFSLICQAMGYPRAVRAIKRDKVFAQELFDYVENDVIFPFVKAQGAVGAKASSGADAWAAFPNLTPELVEEWIIPSAKRLAIRGKKELGMQISAGLAACDYCEEDPSKFDKETMFRCWDVASKTMFLDVAFSAMGRTQDWNMHWLQEYAQLRGKGNRKLPIFGSLNGRFIRDNPPAVITDILREWFDIMGRDGGLLIAIGNVPADTSPKNIHSAVEAVRRLGQYPFAENLADIKVPMPPFQPFDEWLKGQPEEAIIMKAREWKPEAKIIV